MEIQKIVIIYLVIINVVTFFMFGIDKWKAKKSKWRIREAALLGLAVLGGSIGAWLGMKVSQKWVVPLMSWRGYVESGMVTDQSGWSD